MNRKEVRGGGSRRGNDTDMRRKEKENRKLQLELRSEKEKLNSTIIKYQREINEMQAVGGTVAQRRNSCLCSHVLFFFFSHPINTAIAV